MLQADRSVPAIRRQRQNAILIFQVFSCHNAGANLLPINFLHRLAAQWQPQKRRDNIYRITAAKREETREKCLPQTLEWLIEGKSWNWKFERKKS